MDQPAIVPSGSGGALVAAEPLPSLRRGSSGALRRARAALSPTVAAAVLFLVAIALAALLAGLIAPHDPLEQRLEAKLLPPIWERGADPDYLLGTDALGRDIVSRMLHGARISLLVGVGAVAIQALLGAAAGLLAGYYGRWPDALLMRLADIQLAIPSIIIAIVVMALIGSGVLNLIVVLGLTNWVVYGRTVRSETLVVRSMDYAQAARALGANDARIIVRHIFPNVRTSLIVIGSLELAKVIILEASLSFLGLGVQPPTPTWGVMISEARSYIAVYWWLPTLPGLLIFFTALSFNLVGDWLRDISDPTMRAA